MATIEHNYPTQDFLRALLNSMEDHLVVINSEGDIMFTNQAWNDFAIDNGCNKRGDWTTINYLTECEKAASVGDDYAMEAVVGISKVIKGEHSSFYLEYPCNSPTEIRWYMMRVASLINENMNYYVITHSNITERKLAEKEVEKLSRTDALTNIPNRRSFNEFLKNEWLRCKRSNAPISLAIIDVDYFKFVNDTYGHIVGDENLQKLSVVIASYSKRPTDLCARIGGEEFALILGDTEKKPALDIINNLLDAVRALKIPNINSPVLPIITISVGLMTMYPNDDIDEERLLTYSDKLLYEAKEKGRNQVVQDYLSDRVVSGTTTEVE